MSSMTVEQRRTRVIERSDLSAGSVRLAKASSRYDRRRRYWVVEVLPAGHVGHDLEEWLWRGVQVWAVSDPDAEEKAHAAYTTTWLAVRAMSIGLREASNDE